MLRALAQQLFAAGALAHAIHAGIPAQRVSGV
jgi:hypothetical protein